MKRKILSLMLLSIIILNNITVNAVTLDNNEKPNNNQKVTNQEQFIKINNTVAIDSEINMTLYLDNIPYDNFTFKLYSNNSLEEVNTKDIDLKNFNNEEISFDYCINCSTLKTINLNYKLPTTASVGDNITFNIELINKDNNEEYMTHRTTVLVIDSVKEEEKETPEKENIDKDKVNSKTNLPTNYSNFNFTSNVSSSNKSNVSTKYNGSSNNYLSNITIKGYKLNKDFLKERLTYFVTVPNNVKSLNITAKKESSSSSVVISGNSNFEVGLNKVLITVTSEDGRVKNYRIYVTRLDSDTNEE